MTTAQTVTDSKQQKSKNRKIMIILVLVFALPMVLAKFALMGDWFNRGATNKGTLLAPPVELSELLRKEEPIWRLLYIMPESCDVACDNALIAINQVWQAVGRERKRLEPTILVLDNSDTTKLEEITKAEQFLILNTDTNLVQSKFKNQAIDVIFVADTLGNVILHYPLQTEQQEAVLRSRDILADLRKLLKLSRIG